MVSDVTELVSAEKNLGFGAETAVVFWEYQQNVERLIVDAESLASNAKTKFRQGLQYDLPLYKTTCYIHKAATALN